MKINDMLAPPPVLLPALDVDVSDLNQAAVTHPNSPLVWALLAQAALEAAATQGSEPTRYITAYALARTGYHRGLDMLRGNGWKGFGPVPYSHEPNRGVLLAIAQLALAAKAIGETAEYDRCRALLSDCDDSVVAELLD